MNMHIPKVSVVIPAYNRAHCIRDAINSVLSQSWDDYEIIVVDDGSTDNTRQVVKEYGEKVNYIYQENKGVSTARNTGIASAKGEWIAFDAVKPGQTVFTLIPEIIKAALKELPVNRPMRWGNHAVEFVRPVHSVILMYGTKIIPANFFEINTDKITFGHRFLSKGKVIIKHAC